MKFFISCHLPYFPVTSHIWLSLSLAKFCSHSTHLAKTLLIPSICYISVSLSLSCQLPGFLILTPVSWTSLTFLPLQIFRGISSFSCRLPYYHRTSQWFAEHIFSYYLPYFPATGHISLALLLFLLLTLFSWTFIISCHLPYFPATYHISQDHLVFLPFAKFSCHFAYFPEPLSFPVNYHIFLAICHF